MGRGFWPWRLGTTSYILPADLSANVRFLAPRMDDVELVLFESVEFGSNVPGPEVVADLADVAAEHGLTYTIHLPTHVRPGSPRASERTLAVDTWNRVVERTEPLEPFGYVLHLEGDQPGAVPSSDVPAWLENLERSLEAWVGAGGIQPRSICVETLGYPFDLVWPLVRRWGLAVTLDIGHVWVMGFDAEAAVQTLLPHARIVHLHGVDGVGGEDHQGLEVTDPDLLRAFLTSLSRQPGDRVVTLEVFCQEHLESSLGVLERFRRTL